MKKIIVLTSGGGDINFTRDIQLSWSTQYTISKAALNMVITQFALALAAEPRVEGQKAFTVLGLTPGVVSSWSALPSTYTCIPRLVFDELHVHCALITLRFTYRGGRGDVGENENAVRGDEAVCAALGRGASHTGAVRGHDDESHRAG